MAISDLLTDADCHLVFNSEEELAKLFDGQGRQIADWRMSDKAIGGEGFGHHARCPRGEFMLGRSEPRHEVSEGTWFTPVLDLPGQAILEEAGRVGIGVHGGGTGLRHPYAEKQGLLPTEGCFRVENEDNEFLAKMNGEVREGGGVIYFTVEGA